MPRLSQQVWEDRRRHVLESAWTCFSRAGFHATSMDDVVRESGWSSSVVYRYVGGKDELIVSASAEAFGQLQQLIVRLREVEPVPTPRQLVRALVDVLDDDKHGRPYRLSGLILHAWAEAVDDPAVATRGRAAWDATRREFAALVRRWREAGTLPDDVAVADVAAVLALAVPGIVVDETFLGGRGSAALARLLRGVERWPKEPRQG